MKFSISEKPGRSYSDYMSEGTPYIELRLCLSRSAELLALVGAFTALANQFEAYIKRHYPDLDGRAKLYVQHIHASDIVLELVPVIQSVISVMDSMMIVEDFTTRYSLYLTNFIHGNKKEDATRSDLKDFMSQVRIIATDPDAKAILSSATYHETEKTKKAILEFDTQQAKQAEKVIEDQRKVLDLKAYELKENVLMVFYQSNLKNPEVSGPTAEKATIEEISKKPLSIVYLSDLAKERIKHETMEGHRNIYQLGFFVDVYVQSYHGKPAAYRIANVRDIIELPDDEE